MAIKRYRATADNTIANGYQENLATRATGSNMRLADVSEVYSIYGRESSASSELSRIISKFDVTSISTDRTAGTIPASGKVKFYLRLYNAETSKTVPKDFKLVVEAISNAWNEGDGLDLENYKDLGTSNWVEANDSFVSASFVMSLQGGANKATMNGQTFTLTDSSGASQEFTFNIANDVVANGSIGMSSDSNTTGIINTIKSAINDSSLTLDIVASTITAVGDADSEMRLLIKQKTTGYAGNTSVDLSGVAHLSVLDSASGFLNGSGNWATAGGDYHATPTFEQTFETGLEDLELNITSLVEQWIDGTKVNYGVGVRLASSVEADTSSYYTKRFFARGTQYFFKKPVIEARWNSSIQDDRGDFYLSSSLAPGPDNLNTLYLYNYIRGQLTNIPAIGATGSIMVSLYSGSEDNTAPSGSKLILYNGTTNITGGFVSTGIYSCSVAITASDTLPISTLYDVWHSGSHLDEHATSTEYFTGSISVESFAAAASSNGNYRYVTNIKNLRNKYFSEEEARFNVYVRSKNWSPTIYTVASSEIENTIIPSASYRVYRVLDGYNAIPHGTGSDLQTILSYDVSGNYFNLDMSLLEPGYEYGIKLAFYDSQRQSWIEQDQKFLFRVEDYEY